ncbi:hypothetical protein GN242_07540 [Erwinia sorbitola]|uniref:Phage head morphogenesis domain-containing protein n=1 Tax=Erwinia sorbitola TaxID=2681984 RepID=A0A6I6EBG5_9GAMM|nr:hypothetical protein GN242_07540 [Erwinia sorbitola]
MYRDIESRYLDIKRNLKLLFDQRLTGRVREANSERGFILCNNEDGPATLYKVNAGTYIYDMTAAQLADLLQRVQIILDDALLDGGSQNLWALDYVVAEYERGTHQAFTNLSVQSPVYAQQTTLAQLLSTPAYQNQIAAAYVSTYSEWKGISDAARVDLANVIADSIGRGVNPRETASVISKRLDVSMAQAKNIAQTEQVGALRKAQWQETDWARERLGLNTKLLWLSALKLTTRSWHAARHGKTYTTEEVEAFYAENGNRYHCYCSQIPCIVDDNGDVVNRALVRKLAEERGAWGVALKQKAGVQPGVDASYRPPQYDRLKNVTRVNAWAKGTVAENVKIPAGCNIEQLNNCMSLTLELQDRFALPKFRYLGGVTGDIHKYKRSKGMIGGYAHRVSAMLVTRNAFDAQDLLDIDIRARAAGFTAQALKAAELTGNRALISAVSGADAISWHAVPTPRGVFAHEFGHVLHRSFPEQLDKVARDAYGAGWQYAVSKYGQTKYSEYVAEAFSLYIENPTEARLRLYPPLLEVFKKMDKAVK